MNLLLLDDEIGIREGLATILRRKGHRVLTASSLEAGLELLQQERFDLVLSDWHLPDGDADPILASCSCPALVMSGNPEEVRRTANLRGVLSKPVPPRQLLAELEELGVGTPSVPPANGTVPSGELAGLPVDCRDRLNVVLAVLGAQDDPELCDDGTTVTLRVPWAREDAEALRILDQLGGDYRILAPATRPVLEWRLLRDGRPALDVVAVGVGDSWPEADEFAVDLDRRGALAPGPFLALLDRVAEARKRGVTVHLLNIPPHLRFFAEVSGRGHDVPKREKSGPRLPEVLVDLWS